MYQLRKYKKDYKYINRNRAKSHKRQNRKTYKIISQEKLDYYRQIAEYEKERGVFDWCSQPNSGAHGEKFEKKEYYYMYKINKLLFNPWLLPQERVCVKYTATENYSKGKLRDGRIIEFERNGEKHKYEITMKVNKQIIKVFEIPKYSMNAVVDYVCNYLNIKYEDYSL